MRFRHYREPRSVRTLCVQLHRLGDLSEPLYRPPQRRFSRQNLRPNRQKRARSGIGNGLTECGRVGRYFVAAEFDETAV